jgi:hypothetical protein
MHENISFFLFNIALSCLLILLNVWMILSVCVCVCVDLKSVK